MIIPGSGFDGGKKQVVLKCLLLVDIATLRQRKEVDDRHWSVGMVDASESDYAHGAYVWICAAMRYVAMRYVALRYVAMQYVALQHFATGNRPCGIPRYDPEQL